MKRIHLVVLWHMHQPQYRDPGSGRYVLPWTRLHALKDYWGMVEVLREFPNFHATFNVVPSLGMQLEEYASGDFKESWFEKDDVVSRLATKGKDYTEKDKSALRKKQLEFLGLVLPVYREAAQRGQIEISTTPFYHPILPLICDSDIARVANPGTPLPRRAYRRPEDAREQLRRAREYHERVFGGKPAGLWPSEGSVSDQALTIAAEEGFQWFGTDEGVLGRTLNVGFFRDGNGI